MNPLRPPSLGPALRAASLCALLALALPAGAQALLYANAGTCSGLGDLGLCQVETDTPEAPASVATTRQLLNVVEDFGPPFGAGSLDAEAQAVARPGQVSTTVSAAMSEFPLGRFVASDIVNGPAFATAVFNDQLLATGGAGELRVRFAVGSSGFSALPGVQVGGSYYLGLGSETFQDVLGAPQVLTSAWQPITPGVPLALFGLARADTLVVDGNPPRDIGSGSLQFSGQLLVLGFDIRSADGTLAIEAASGMRYDITALPVPEPSTALLLSLGGVALIGWTRRRLSASRNRLAACSHSGESH